MHIEIQAPARRGSNWVLAGSLKLDTGDALTVEAIISPESALKARSMGLKAAGSLAAWAKKNVSLTGNWEALGPLGIASAAILQSVAAHPVLAAPAIADSLKTVWHGAQDGNGKAIDAARAVMASSKPGHDELKIDFAALNAAGRILANPDCRRVVAQLRGRCHRDPYASELLGAVHDYGTCCCGKVHIRSSYDPLRFQEPIADSIAVHVSNCMLLRSLAKASRMPAEVFMRQIRGSLDKAY